MKHKEKKLKEGVKAGILKSSWLKRRVGGHEKTMSTVGCVKSGALTERTL